MIRVPITRMTVSNATLDEVRAVFGEEVELLKKPTDLEALAALDRLRPIFIHDASLFPPGYERFPKSRLLYWFIGEGRSMPVIHMSGETFVRLGTTEYLLDPTGWTLNDWT